MSDMTPMARIFEEVSCLDASLAEKLSRHAGLLSGVEPGLAAANAEMMAGWARARVAANRPKPGEHLPDFLLPNHRGQLVSSKDLLAKGPLVISFNRGHWCPMCRLELLELTKAYPKIKRAGADVVSVMPEKSEYTRAAIGGLSLPFQILSDMDLSLAIACGLLAPVTRKVQRICRRLGVDLPRFQDAKGWNVPIPGTFVVNPKGVVLASFASPNLLERMPIATILGALPRKKFKLFG